MKSLRFLKQIISNVNYEYVPAKVVIIEARLISVSVLFASAVKGVFEKVQCIVLVSVGGSSKSDGTGLIVKGAWQVFTIIFTPCTISGGLKEVKGT